MTALLLLTSDLTPHMPGEVLAGVVILVVGGASLLVGKKIRGWFR